MKSLVEEIESAGSGGDSFAGTWTGGYHIQQDPVELAGLIDALLPYQINNYLQVGSAAGGNERFLSEKLGVKNLYIVDNGEHWQFSTWTTSNRPALESQGVTVTQHIGDSHAEAAENFIRTLPHMDLIGIDGDHTPAGVRMDWELITPCLKPGTLVWFHDINCCDGPHEIWVKLKAKHTVIFEMRKRFGIGLMKV